MKKIFLILLSLFMTACSSTMPKKATTHQEFYNQPTLKPPKSQCVYKSAITETEKAQVHEQGKKLREIIYQNWQPPVSARGKRMDVRFGISPTCQIFNIYVDEKDPAFKQSVMTALQNTNIEGIEYDVFKMNKMAFIAR